VLWCLHDAGVQMKNAINGQKLKAGRCLTAGYGLQRHKPVREMPKQANCCIPAIWPAKWVTQVPQSTRRRAGFSISARKRRCLTRPEKSLQTLRYFIAMDKTQTVHVDGNPLAWLKTKPSLAALREAFPEIWQEVESELIAAQAADNPARLHALLNPASSHDIGKKPSPREQAIRVRSAIKQRMTALAVERHALALVTGQISGKVRFNLFNGMLAQRLLFKRGFERKPVSLFWFKLLWPLIWQKHFLMPLVERKGIYCFYSRALIDQLATLIGHRKCLEIAAGDGTLTRFLQTRGVAITATDDHSWPDRINYPDSVVRMDAETALRKHAPQVVICSWPPAQNSFEREIFRTPSVELYIVIASQHRFASGNWADYEAQKGFNFEQSEALSRLVLPPELGSMVSVFTRKTG